MIQGKIVEEFGIKKGERILRIVFRYPSIYDAKQAMEFINVCRKKHSFLGQHHFETLESEKSFLKKAINDMGKRRAVFIFAECNERIIGSAAVRCLHLDCAKHVAEFGVMLLPEFIGLGLGEKISRKVIEIAKKETALKALTANCFSQNSPSISLHKKLGFKQWGCFPKEYQTPKGEFGDGIHFFLEL
jgi:RimJ/RimL family protein N-acetyltransferase